MKVSNSSSKLERKTLFSFATGEKVKHKSVQAVILS